MEYLNYYVSLQIYQYIFVFPCCKTVNLKMNYMNIIVDKSMISCTKLKCDNIDVARSVASRACVSLSWGGSLVLAWQEGKQGLSGGLVLVRSLVQPDPLPGYRHEPNRQMLHECQMEEYMETRLFFFNHLCSLLRSHRALNLGLVPALRPVNVDGRVWTWGVNVGMPCEWQWCVSLWGRPLCCELCLQFPRIWTAPLFGGEGNRWCHLLHVIMSYSKSLNYRVWLYKECIFCLMQEHTLERQNNSYFSTVRLCVYPETVFTSPVSVYSMLPSPSYCWATISLLINTQCPDAALPGCSSVPGFLFTETITVLDELCKVWRWYKVFI